MRAEIRRKSSMTIIGEGKREVREDEYWMMLDGFKNPYFDPKQPLTKYNLPYTDEPYQNRNYVLFALLADVRNGLDIKPLSKPKGIPKELSSDMDEYIKEWGGDGHSHSWFTLKELKEIDWNQIVDFEVHLTKEDYLIYDKIKRLPYRSTERYFEDRPHKITLREFIFESCKEFIDTIRDLENIAHNEKVTEEQIRIVFFFDN